MTRPQAISFHPPLELSQDAVIIFGTFGIQRQFIEEKIESIRDEISEHVYDEFSRSAILPEKSSAKDCFTYGYVCRVLEPGKNWSEGRLRFRIVVEFVPEFTHLSTVRHWFRSMGNILEVYSEQGFQRFSFKIAIILR